MRFWKPVGLATSLALASTYTAQAASPNVKLYETGDKRCIESNGVPNHAIGTFPNPGNPNSFRTQNLKFCFPKNPVRTGKITRRTPNIGVALNGIVIRPGTADWYDPSSPRGFSRDRSSGWNLEGMGSASALGIDKNNAHVDNRGLYHYHGPPPASVSKGTLIGYAADGFEIHYVGVSAQPSYLLKKGTRPTPPGGRYDGRFLQDWEYVKGSGNLDECNGKKMDGKYVYFATETFPFFPRCHWGTVSADFSQRGPAQDPMSQRRPAGNLPGLGARRPQGGGFGRPRGGSPGGPLAAAAAELGISEHQLAQAVGPPPPNVERAARLLGISEERLREVLQRHRPR